MAIVKMKKLRVMAMASDHNVLMKGLLHLGCVEISEPDDKLADPKWSALLRRGTSSLVETKSRITDVNTALDAIKRYGGLKDGLFIKRHPISEKEFLNADTAEHANQTAKKVNGLLEELTKLQNKENHLLSAKASLLPWSSLNLPLECGGTKHAFYRIGVCPGAADIGAIRTELAASDAAAELVSVDADKEQHYLLLICYRDDEEKAMDLLRPHNFSVVTFPGRKGTPAENLQQLDEQIRSNHQAQDAVIADITKCNAYRDALRAYADHLDVEAELETDSEHLLTDGTILFFEGWAPEDSIPRVKKFLEERGCAWEFSDPTPEEYPDVPVKLKNNWFTKPLNLVTEMYSLPAYDGVDPNPWMAPFFILFYGMMMADMGYGILMILAAVLIRRKYAPKGTTGRLFDLLGLCGVSTFIWGALSGGFFGDFIPQIAKIINPNTTLTALPALFTPLNDTMSILVGSLILGFIQVNVGMIISVLHKAKEGHPIDGFWEEGSWWVILAGIITMILHVGRINGVPVVLIIGLVMLVIGSTRKARGLQKIPALIGAIYNGVTGYFSDILSYSRLMALMLSGSVIAQVFNTMGAITGNVVTFIIISMLGNTMNFLLNLLGCYVHDLRLQCLEFFNRFYKDGGKPFHPLAADTKYVDIE